MTNIEIYKDGLGNIVKFIIDGHSGYSDNEDIVCAAISTISYSTLMGIEKVLKIKFGYENKDGYIFFTMPSDLDEKSREKANILLDTMYLFLLDLEKQYDKNVSVKVMEV